MIFFLITDSAWGILKYEQKKIDVSLLRKGDVILTGTNKNLSSFYIKISNLLTIGMDSKFWTHAALHMGDGKLIEAQPKGICFNSIDAYLKNGALVKVYRHKYISDDRALDRLIDFCLEQKKKDCKYGVGGLLFYVLASFLPLNMAFIFDNDKVDKFCNLDNAYFCSELVAEAYEKAGHKIDSYDAWRIKPSYFMENPFFVEIKL